MDKRDLTCRLFPYVREDCVSMQDVRQNAAWSISAFELPKAWQSTQGEGVTIAVLDTGCDLDHPDLVENLLPGINMVDGSQAPIDGCGHGTHVTGTLVAAHNDFGVVGVAPKAKVRPVKVLDDSGNGNLLNVAKGIDWAIDQNVDFISLSLGSPNRIHEVYQSIRRCEEAGIIVFCAAGNAGETQNIFYPAAYDEAISIGAIDQNMCRASFSCTGMNLDFMAPGVEILSTVPKNWYAKLSGTSMATPFAIGVAALLLSYSRLTGRYQLSCSDDYRNTFKRFTTPISNGNYTHPEFYQGFGIIDPRKFVEAMADH